MRENSSVKETFDQLATTGYLGDPAGEMAFCYIRVSSAQQAEDGRTGLPRQLQHCHEIAQERHLKIPWELVFADDGFSGFEFEIRPALTRLREEIKGQPRTHHLVIEHLDRLSRNARWHQGFLLEEFAKCKITVVFWKAFSSEIERAVLGTVAEEGMRSEISRMTDGMILKAKSGRVTSKRPRFGYVFVDSEGKPSDKARKDTHYAIDPEKSQIVRWIFNCVILEHKSLRQIAKVMNEKKIPPMFTGQLWCSGTIARIISDQVYKGEFYAHRWYCERNGKVNEKGRPQGIMRQRPPEEWIKVSVPAIISPDEWQLAQDNLASNRTRSLRNMKKWEWLLSSFGRCEVCGYAYVAVIGGGKNRPIRYYGCNGRHTDRALANQSSCVSPYVRADRLEEFVWSKVENIVTNPELFIRLLQESKGEQASEEQLHLEFIERQLKEAVEKHDRWKKAYDAGIIPMEEYRDYRTQFDKQKAELEQARREVERKIGRRLSQEAQKRLILAALAELRRGLPEKGDEVAFELKRRMLQQMLDCIWIDSTKETIRFEGVLKSKYEVEETEFVFGYNRISR